MNNIVNVNLMPLNYTLKIVIMVNAVYLYFSTIKKGNIRKENELGIKASSSQSISSLYPLLHSYLPNIFFFFFTDEKTEA